MILFIIAEVTPVSTSDNDKESHTYKIRGTANEKMSPPPPPPAGFKDLGSIVENPSRSADAAANDDDDNGGDAREQADDGPEATATEVDLYPQGVKPEKRVDWRGENHYISILFNFYLVLNILQKTRRYMVPKQQFCLEKYRWALT